MRKFGFRANATEPIDDTSTLVQVMAWCRQAAIHSLSQYLSRPMVQYEVTVPHWFDGVDIANIRQQLLLQYPDVWC